MHMNVDESDTCFGFRKQFTLQPNGPSKISWSVHGMHVPMRSDLQNALAYFATAVDYTLKLYMKLTPGANVIKSFWSMIYGFSY